ncbi:imm11 family protein [Cystobacter ferrugineus]|uniref:Immunity MXAN-0049 protein domain-containing protein n=1 Tax=Cystobacter ferrugineus TaxID=83449 RepID=A0A1L9AX00_9BACT|nr:DUF1629 domain-containing protein [Cystobacter ferrugineus]OJH34527.1 hypothetical protein BON30_42745 [Cystobacter ferrugineus]
MERNFYVVEIGDVPQWCLDTPVPVAGGTLDDPWMFVEGKLVPDPGPLKTKPFHHGEMRTFTVANADRTPIANEQVARAFRELAPDDVQLFPVDVEGTPERYYIVNATRSFKCVDEKNSREVQVYPPDGAVPERVGEYRSISGLRIDTSKIENARVFRPMGWEVALVVSEEIKARIERIGNTGVYFNRVTGPHASNEG